MCVLSLRTSRLSATEPTAITPSTDRSMLPSRMTNVSPSARTSGMEAALATRTRFAGAKNMPRCEPISAHSPPQHQHRDAGPQASSQAAPRGERHAWPRAETQLRNGPLTRPHRSLKSIFGGASMLLL